MPEPSLMTECRIPLCDTECVLRHDGSAYLPEYQALLLSDLHLGKDIAFRVSGIPVPAGINRASLERVSRAINQSLPSTVFILGDLVHNVHSLSPNVVQLFEQWRKIHKDLAIHLILGNHDRRAVNKWPDSWRLNLHNEFQLGPFTLYHNPFDQDLPNDQFVIGGHLHPVVKLFGTADFFRLPCFVVTRRFLVLPSLGTFTGGHPVQPSGQQQLYAISDGHVWPIPAIRR